jgi:hypothetical protein
MGFVFLDAFTGSPFVSCHWKRPSLLSFLLKSRQSLSASASCCYAFQCRRILDGPSQAGQFDVEMNE